MVSRLSLARWVVVQEGEARPPPRKPQVGVPRVAGTRTSREEKFVHKPTEAGALQWMKYEGHLAFPTAGTREDPKSCENRLAGSPSPLREMKRPSRMALQTWAAHSRVSTQCLHVHKLTQSDTNGVTGVRWCQVAFSSHCVEATWWSSKWSPAKRSGRRVSTRPHHA